MAITWGNFHDYVRTAVLNDEIVAGRDPRWDEAQLLLLTKSSLAALCSHTAPIKELIVPDFTGTDYVLPVDVYDSFGNTAYVEVFKGTSTPVRFRSVYHTRGVNPSSTGSIYTELPTGSIRFGRALSGETIRILYFSMYDTPSIPTDIINIPVWAETALAYLVGAYAQSNFAMRRAQLSQWAENPERGSPEDNPFRIMHKWFISIYDSELSRVASQNRSNFFSDDE